MTLKRHITGSLVILMLWMQLALAQHFTVHFNEEEYTGARHHAQQALPADADVAAAATAPAGQDHDIDDVNDKICQLCLFSKYFSHTLLSVDAAFLFTSVETAFVAPDFQARLAQYRVLGYFSRGPPSLFS